jgi:ATP-dependent Clp protease adapter protein ClpS
MAALAELSPAEQELAGLVLQRILNVTEQDLGPPDPQIALAALPEALRAAMETQDRDAFAAAFDALPPEEQQRAAAILQDLTGEGQTQQLAPAYEEQAKAVIFFTLAVALVALGDEHPRPAVAAFLAQLGADGAPLRLAIERIWAGERDADALVVGLAEPLDAWIRIVLALLQLEPVLAGLPGELIMAFLNPDQSQVLEAMRDALSDEQRTWVSAQSEEPIATALGFTKAGANMAQVILLNDDATPIDFLITTLRNECGIAPLLAVTAALRVHFAGRCPIALLPHAEAEALAARIEAQARAAGFPTSLVVEAVAQTSAPRSSSL